jgi:hypothetical protein
LVGELLSEAQFLHLDTEVIAELGVALSFRERILGLKHFPTIAGESLRLELYNL